MSNKNLVNIADIDFRKSRTSLIDDNLLIDSGNSLINIPVYRRQLVPCANNTRLRSLTPNFHSGAHISLSPGQILVANTNNRDANFILRSRSPGASRLRSLTPSSLRQENNYSCSNSLKYNENRHSSLTSLSANHINSIINNNNNNDHTRNHIQVNHFFPKLSRPFAYETDEYETDVGGEENEYARVRTPCKSDRSKLNNPKMFANHLVWNQSSKSAECLDCNYDTIKTHLISTSKQPLNPIARVVSPGI